MTTTRRDVLRIGAGTTLGALVASYSPRALAADNVCPPREGAVLYVYDQEQPDSRKSITAEQLEEKVRGYLAK